MRIAVIAANGRSGKAFVMEALDQRHSINAGVHSHSDFEPNPHLSVIKCDSTNKQDLKRLINGQDAVVSLIGHNKKASKDIQSLTIQNTLEVMSELNMKRIISLTGTGVRFTGDKISLIDKILNYSINIIDPDRINDGKRHVELLKDSQSDWTVLRVLKLMNTPAKAFKLSLNGPSKIFVSRDEVAQAILEILRDDRYIQQAPIVGKP
jgi:putative NADH-flavin reductase